MAFKYNSIDDFVKDHPEEQKKIKLREKAKKKKMTGYMIHKDKLTDLSDKKEKMAHKMPNKERDILEKAHLKSFGKPMPEHLKKDYPNIK